ncbi:MAG TPA: PEGA domain-containing protein [Vicinamibacteria bacterium]|nr:PEGA domain-containing protein [Vicinamibacteria bacterium]
MSFLETQEETHRGRGPFIALTLIVLVGLGALGYWFFGRPSAPSTAPEPSRPAVVEEEPEPEPVEVAPATEAVSVGSISIRSSEAGATVFIDGEPVGPAPFERDEFAIGQYEVRVEKEGYKPFVDTLRVRPGRHAELYASLDLLSPSLRIVSDIPGATVFLDRQYVGTTPVDVKELEVGSHQLTVSAEGFDMHVETIEVTTGRNEVNVRFEAAAASLDLSIAVTHKHRFGSCEGMLRADASGLFYETDNENDGFRTAFAELERFEVDYIDKNLNVKARSGRNFNFTDKSGNADALFVFHRQVQEFREKL